MRVLTFLPVLLAVGAAPAAAPLRIALPIACTLGKDCVIQNYPDDDPGPAARDYECQGRTYQGHDGTDIRILSMARQRAGVAVLAAAPGVVLRVRDGVEDVSVRDLPPGAVVGRECGNGVVIDHGPLWQTQYCHMAKGSVIARPGEQVAAGTPLGQVGLSGDTEFPHVHLTVRYQGKAVDPFAWNAAPGACGGGASLWKKTPAYRMGQVLVAGFAAAPITMAQVQDMGQDQPQPARGTPLVAFVQAIGLAAGDVQQLVLHAPDGAVLAENGGTLDHDKAQTLLYAGRKAPPGGWPAGEYRADYTVTRGGNTVVANRSLITIG